MTSLSRPLLPAVLLATLTCAGVSRAQPQQEPPVEEPAGDQEAPTEAEEDPPTAAYPVETEPVEAQAAEPAAAEPEGAGVVAEAAVGVDDQGPCGGVGPGARDHCRRQRRFWRRLPGHFFSLFGLRGTVTDVEQRDTAFAATVFHRSVSYGTGEMGSFRSSNFGYLGGGSAGLEGGLGVDDAVGWRIPFGDDHGPLARVGLRAHLLGNDDLYESTIELPQVQLGYQLLREGLQLEAAARGGAVLIGRYNPAGGKRPTGGSFEWGGYAALRFGPVHAELELIRTEVTGAPETPITRTTAELCALADVGGLCLFARNIRGDVQFTGGAREIVSNYAGLSIGLGDVSQKLASPRRAVDP